MAKYAEMVWLVVMFVKLVRGEGAEVHAVGDDAVEAEPAPGATENDWLPP